MPTEKLISALQYLGIDVNTGEQDSRIIIQKIAYILKVLGYGIDFKFYRGSRGPYAFPLNREILENRWLYDELQSSYELGDNEKTILHKVKQSGIPLTVHRLEGATSAMFVMQEDLSRDDVEVLKELRNWKETFSDEQLTVSLMDAKRLLFMDEYLTPKLREELSAWQDLGMESVSQNPS